MQKQSVNTANDIVEAANEPLKPVQAAGESFEADEMAKALVTLQH